MVYLFKKKFLRVGLLINRKEQRLWFRHYWMDKPKIVNNEDGFSLIKETEQLDNSVKNHIFQNISKKIRTKAL